MNLTQAKKLSPVRIDYGRLIFQYHSFDKRIEIDNTVNNNDKIVGLLHEIGHAICHKNHCRCMVDYNNHALAEYHAARFTMKHVRDNQKLIAIFISEINRALNCYSSAHRTAAKRIIKLKAWSRLQC